MTIVRFVHMRTVSCRPQGDYYLRNYKFEDSPLHTMVRSNDAQFHIDIMNEAKQRIASFGINLRMRRVARKIQRSKPNGGAVADIMKIIGKSA